MNFLRRSTLSTASASSAAAARQFLFSSSFSTSSVRSNVARMTLIGRVGSDLVAQVSQNEKQYLKYALAVNTSRDNTSWFNIVVFDENEINYMTNYVNKG